MFLLLLQSVPAGFALLPSYNFREGVYARLLLIMNRARDLFQCPFVNVTLRFKRVFLQTKKIVRPSIVHSEDLGLALKDTFRSSLLPVLRTKKVGSEPNLERQPIKILEVYEGVVFCFRNRFQTEGRTGRIDIAVTSKEGVPLAKSRRISHKNITVLIKEEVAVFSGG